MVNFHALNMLFCYHLDIVYSIDSTFGLQSGNYDYGCSHIVDSLQIVKRHLFILYKESYMFYVKSSCLFLQFINKGPKLRRAQSNTVQSFPVKRCFSRIN